MLTNLKPSCGYFSLRAFRSFHVSPVLHPLIE